MNCINHRLLLFSGFLCILLISAAQAQQRSFGFDRIDLHRDLPYAETDNPRQRLDLLLPKERANDKPLPVVAFIHGGGWRKGDKRSGIGRLAPLVASGKFAGVSIGYRLSDESQWPSQIHDCKAAIRWIRAHAKQNNLDADHIAVWGTSAGGHLVAALGTTGGVEKLEGELGPHTDQSSRVTCVVNYFGPANFSTMNDHPSQIDHLAAGASPETYISADDAPQLLAHGTKDRLVPYQQSVVFAKKLDKAGVPVYLIEMTDAGHGFRSPELDRRVRAFLGKYLLDEQTEISTEAIRSEPPRRR